MILHNKKHLTVEWANRTLVSATQGNGIPGDIASTETAKLIQHILFKGILLSVRGSQY